MEAIVLTGRNQFEYRDNQTVPRPGPDEVRLRVLAAGICGTDVHITQGDESILSMIKPPVILGHEFCGEVEAVGAQVRNLKVGDYVSSEMHLVCKQCPACKDSKFHACQFTKVQGIHQDGAFASFVVVPAWNVVKLPRSIPIKVGAILDALGNAVHTTCKTNLRDRSVTIIGYGPIGAMSTEIANFCEASHIYIVDVNDQALARAQHWVEMRKIQDRVTLINAAKTNAIEEIRDLTKGGSDVGLEFSGAASGINTVFGATRAGGEVSLLGIPKDKDVLIKDYGSNIIWKGLTIHAIIGREIFKTWDTMIGLIGRGLDVSPIITGEYPLKEFASGIEKFRLGEEQKVVLYPAQ